MDETYESEEILALLAEARKLSMASTKAKRWRSGPEGRVARLQSKAVKLPAQFTSISKRSMAVDPFNADGSPTGLKGIQFEKAYLAALNMLGLDYLSQTAPALWDFRPIGKGWPELIKGKDINIKRHGTEWMFSDRFIKRILGWTPQKFALTGPEMFTGYDAKTLIKMAKSEKPTKGFLGVGKDNKSAEARDNLIAIEKRKIEVLDKELKKLARYKKKVGKRRKVRGKWTSALTKGQKAKNEKHKKKLEKFTAHRDKAENRLKELERLKKQESLQFIDPPKGVRSDNRLPVVPPNPALVRVQELRIKLYLRDTVGLHNYLFMAPKTLSVERAIVGLTRKAFKLMTEPRSQRIFRAFIRKKPNDADIAKMKPKVRDTYDKDVARLGVATLAYKEAVARAKKGELSYRELEKARKALAKATEKTRISAKKEYLDVNPRKAPKFKKDIPYADKLKLSVILDELNKVMTGDNFVVYKFPKEFDVSIHFNDENNVLAPGNYVKRFNLIVGGKKVAHGKMDKEAFLINGYKRSGLPAQGWDNGPKKVIPSKIGDDILWKDAEVMNKPPALVTIDTQDKPVSTPEGAMMRALSHLTMAADRSALKRENTKRLKDDPPITKLPEASRLFTLSSGTSKLKQGFFRTTGNGWDKSGILPGNALIKVLDSPVLTTSEGLAKELPWVGGPSKGYLQKTVIRQFDKGATKKVSPKSAAIYSFNASDVDKLVRGHIQIMMKSYGLDLKMPMKATKTKKARVIRPDIYYAIPNKGGLSKLQRAIREFEKKPFDTDEEAIKFFKSLFGKEKPFVLVPVPKDFSIRVNQTPDGLLNYVDVIYGSGPKKDQLFLRGYYQDGVVVFKVMQASPVSGKGLLKFPTRLVKKVAESRNWECLPFAQDYLNKTVLRQLG